MWRATICSWISAAMGTHLSVVNNNMKCRAQTSTSATTSLRDNRPGLLRAAAPAASIIHMMDGRGGGEEKKRWRQLMGFLRSKTLLYISHCLSRQPGRMLV